MSRRRSSRNRGLSLSLFPFLAVLICTMGVLIVLLVIVSRQADLTAQTHSSESKQQIVELIEQQQLARDTERFRAEGLSALQPELRDRLADARIRRSHLEEEIRKLEEQADRLVKAHQSLNEDDPAVVNQTELAAIRAELLRKIELARQTQEQMRLQVQKASRTYAVVPYPGPSGTRRRPIYIECKRDGIHLQPHGIRLTQRELKAPVLAGNPLDSALLAVREYWRKYDIQQDSEPYPLIVVRPDGAEAYAMVRTAMKSWDDEFGYELVTDDAELEFPGKDPQLARLLEEVVAKAVREQEKLHRAIKLQQEALAIRNGNTHGRGGLGGGSGSGLLGSSSGANSGGDQVVLRASSGRGGFEIQQGEAPNSNRSDGGQASAFDSGRSVGQTAQSQSGSEFGSNSTDSGDSPQANSFREASTSPRQSYGTYSRNSGDRSFQEGRNQQRGNSGSGQYSPGRPSRTGGQSSDSSSQNSSSTASSARGANQNSGTGGNSQFNSGRPPSASLAESRGKGWALPGKTPNATAYRRPIYIDLHADHLVVLPGSFSHEPTRMIAMNERQLAPHVDEMVDGVWRIIDSWDFAGYNAYWKPELHVRVHEGADQTFAELQQLMAGSGLETVRKAP